MDNKEFLVAHPEYAELDEAVVTRLRSADELEVELATERNTRTAIERKNALDAVLANVPERALFDANYQGELTPEAIKAEASKYPSLLPPEGGNENQTHILTAAEVQAKADLDAMRRVQSAMGGAGGAPTGIQALDDFTQKLASVRSPQEFDQIMREAPAESGIVAAGPRLV